MLNPVFNSLDYNAPAIKLRSQSVAECRFPQTSEISEVIAVQPQLATVSCEASSGRVNYAGKLVLTVSYCDEEGKLCRMQKGVEFSHYADDERLAPANSCTCSLCVERLTVKREGSSFLISAIIGADICVYARRQRQFTSVAEGAYLDVESVKFPSIICYFGESEVEDDFEADGIADILTPCAKPIVLSAVCATGEVEVSGEIYLSLFAMRRNSPVCFERVIPFKCNIPCDEARAGVRAAATVEVADMNVTATVNEEKSKCGVGFTCSLAVSGRFCDESEEEVALDAFSETNEIKVERATEEYESCVDIKVYSERICSLAATKSRLTYACTFLAAALPRAECAFNPATGAVEGAVNTTLIYMQDGEIKSCEVSLPVAVTLNGVAEDGQCVDVDVAVCGVGVRLKAEGEAEAEATLKIAATVTQRKSVGYVCALEEGEPLEMNDCAVSVFLPAAGDCLWDVAKKLKKSPAEVAAANRELSFPLTGRERIIVYRGKRA